MTRIPDAHRSALPALLTRRLCLRMGLQMGLGAGLGTGLLGALPSAHARPPVQLPGDGGAHLDRRIEWWYLTGWANTAEGEARYGFQLTFFRRRLDATQAMRSPLAAKHLLFADAAITDVAGNRLWHAQRIARWSGAAAGSNEVDLGWASEHGTDMVLGNWSLRDDGVQLHAQAQDADLSLDLHCTPTQAPVLQGAQGLSRKGPDAHQFSYYYSLPQLQVQGRLQLANTSVALRAGSTAWLDHEWSDALLHADASGWDWIGLNLHDGSALTAFRLRNADGSVLWAGGSFRSRGKLQVFAPEDIVFEALRTWRSPLSEASYPVAWRIATPAGNFTVQALVDAQEIDSRLTTGAVYWEGLCAVLDAAHAPAGHGYLEMTGYAAPLQT